MHTLATMDFLAISKIKLPEKFKLLKNFRSFKIALVTEET